MSSTIHMNVASLHHHHHHNHLNNHLNSHSNEMILKCNSNNTGSKKRLNGFCASSKSAHPNMNNGSKMNYNNQNNHGPPSSVARRNERERNRVKMVNMGFATLRQHVPNGTKNKKMSKVETLRSAVEYIRQLQKLLGQTAGTSSNSSSNNENECYDGTNDYDHYTLQQALNVTSPGSGNGSNGDVENCYSTTMLSPTSITLVDNGIMEQNYSNSPNKHLTMYMNQPNHNQHHHHQHHQQHNHQNPHQHSTSPSPSIDSSDLTGSSTSPYATETNVINNHSNHHSHSHHAHYDTASNNDPDDELFDFVNWF